MRPLTRASKRGGLAIHTQRIQQIKGVGVVRSMHDEQKLGQRILECRSLRRHTVLLVKSTRHPRVGGPTLTSISSDEQQLRFAPLQWAQKTKQQKVFSDTMSRGA